MKNWIIEWLSEKSTWLGFFAVGGAFGFDLSEPQKTALAALAVTFFYIKDPKRGQ